MNTEKIKRISELVFVVCLITVVCSIIFPLWSTEMTVNVIIASLIIALPSFVLSVVLD